MQFIFSLLFAFYKHSGLTRMRKWTRLEGIQDKGGLWSLRMQKQGLVTEQGWWPGQEKSKARRYPCSESPTWGWDRAGGEAQDSLCSNRRLRAMLLKAVKTPVPAAPGNKGLGTFFFLIFQMRKECYWHHWAEKVRDAAGCGAVQTTASQKTSHLQNLY